MKTYKLGNKIKCIIRSFGAGFIGSQEMKYDNQPYTILKDVDVSFAFEDKAYQAKTTPIELGYVDDFLKEITISNVELNDKILNLIFSKNEEKICTNVENQMIENYIFKIDKDLSEIAQVFIYNCDGHLIAATGELKLQEGNNTEIDIRTFDDFDTNSVTYDPQDVLIVYSYQGDKSYSFKKNIEKKDKNILYLTLDFILEDNNTEDLNDYGITTSFIHITKCYLQINKNMYFNRSLNAVDLKFIVVEDEDGESHITLE